MISAPIRSAAILLAASVAAANATPLAASGYRATITEPWTFVLLGSALALVGLLGRRAKRH